MPDGGAITVAARNAEVSAGAARGGSSRSSPTMGRACPRTEEGLSPALTSYFKKGPAQRPTGLGLHQIQRFAEGRGSAVGIESERCAGTLVRLFLRRTGSWACPAVSSVR